MAIIVDRKWNAGRTHTEEQCVCCGAAIGFLQCTEVQCDTCGKLICTWCCEIMARPKKICWDCGRIDDPENKLGASDRPSNIYIERASEFPVKIRGGKKNIVYYATPPELIK